MVSWEEQGTAVIKRIRPRMWIRHMGSSIRRTVMKVTRIRYIEQDHEDC